MDQDVRTLTNELLIVVLDKRVELETQNEAEMIDFIREIMHRRLWLEFGATSMFDFLTRARYHYAPVVAQRKIDAARLMQQYPEVKSFLQVGDINLTQLGMVASAFRQKSVPNEVQLEILISIKGQTVKNTQVILNEKLETEIKDHTKVRIQRDGSVHVEMTFSKEEWELIERAKQIISHSVPSGDLPKVLAHCVQFTLNKKDSSKDSSKDVQKVQSTSIKEVKARQKTVSRAARRFVFQRDQSCRFKHPDGKKCESKYQLQVDHIEPKWRGGGSQIQNLQLLCGLHNRHKFGLEKRKVGPA